MGVNSRPTAVFSALYCFVLALLLGAQAAVPTNPVRGIQAFPTEECLIHPLSHPSDKNAIYCLSQRGIGPQILRWDLRLLPNHTSFSFASLSPGFESFARIFPTTFVLNSFGVPSFIIGTDSGVLWQVAVPSLETSQVLVSTDMNSVALHGISVMPGLVSFIAQSSVFGNASLCAVALSSFSQTTPSAPVCQPLLLPFPILSSAQSVAVSVDSVFFLVQGLNSAVCGVMFQPLLSSFTAAVCTQIQTSNYAGQSLRRLFFDSQTGLIVSHQNNSLVAFDAASLAFTTLPVTGVIQSLAPDESGTMYTITRSDTNSLAVSGSVDSYILSCAPTCQFSLVHSSPYPSLNNNVLSSAVNSEGSWVAFVVNQTRRCPASVTCESIEMFSWSVGSVLQYMNHVDLRILKFAEKSRNLANSSSLYVLFHGYPTAFLRQLEFSSLDVVSETPIAGMYDPNVFVKKRYVDYVLSTQRNWVFVCSFSVVWMDLNLHTQQVLINSSSTGTSFLGAGCTMDSTAGILYVLAQSTLFVYNITGSAPVRIESRPIWVVSNRYITMMQFIYHPLDPYILVGAEDASSQSTAAIPHIFSLPTARGRTDIQLLYYSNIFSSAIDIAIIDVFQEQDGDESVVWIAFSNLVIMELNADTLTIAEIVDLSAALANADEGSADILDIIAEPNAVALIAALDSAVVLFDSTVTPVVVATVFPLQLTDLIFVDSAFVFPSANDAFSLCSLWQTSIVDVSFALMFDNGCPPGNAISDTDQSLFVCTPCMAGSVSPGGNLDVCQLCNPGEYQTLPQASVCNLCPSGTFSALPGAGSCETCSNGSISRIGSAKCYACPANLYSPTVSAGCIPCPVGSVCNPGSPFAISSFFLASFQSLQYAAPTFDISFTDAPTLILKVSIIFCVVFVGLVGIIALIAWMCNFRSISATLSRFRSCDVFFRRTHGCYPGHIMIKKTSVNGGVFSFVFIIMAPCLLISLILNAMYNNQLLVKTLQPINEEKLPPVTFDLHIELLAFTGVCQSSAFSFSAVSIAVDNPTFTQSVSSYGDPVCVIAVSCTNCAPQDLELLFTFTYTLQTKGNAIALHAVNSTLSCSWINEKVSSQNFATSVNGSYPASLVVNYELLEVTFHNELKGFVEHGYGAHLRQTRLSVSDSPAETFPIAVALSISTVKQEIVLSSAQPEFLIVTQILGSVVGLLGLLTLLMKLAEIFIIRPIKIRDHAEELAGQQRRRKYLTAQTDMTEKLLSRIEMSEYPLRRRYTFDKSALSKDEQVLFSPVLAVIEQSLNDASEDPDSAIRMNT
eukprot:ANDGO_05364.mRNA.1 member of the kelch motif protein family